MRVLRVAGRRLLAVCAGVHPGAQLIEHRAHPRRFAPVTEVAQQQGNHGDAVEVLRGRGLHGLYDLRPRHPPAVRSQLRLQLGHQQDRAVHLPVAVLVVGGGEPGRRLVVPADEEPGRRVDLVDVRGVGQVAGPLRPAGPPRRQARVDVRGPHRVEPADVVAGVAVVDVEPVERELHLAGALHPRRHVVGQFRLAPAQEAHHRVDVVVEGRALVDDGHRLPAGRGPALHDPVPGEVDGVRQVGGATEPAGLGQGRLVELLGGHGQALAVEQVGRALRVRCAAGRVADLLQPLVDEVAARRGGRPRVVLAPAELDETGAGERRPLGGVVG